MDVPWRDFSLRIRERTRDALQLYNYTRAVARDDKDIPHNKSSAVA